MNALIIAAAASRAFALYMKCHWRYLMSNVWKRNKTLRI